MTVCLIHKGRPVFAFFQNKNGYCGGSLEASAKKKSWPSPRYKKQNSAYPIYMNISTVYRCANVLYARCTQCGRIVRSIWFYTSCNSIWNSWVDFNYCWHLAFRLAYFLVNSWTAAKITNLCCMFQCFWFRL